MIPLSYFQSEIDKLRADGFDPIAVARDVEGKNMIVFETDPEADTAYESIMHENFWTYCESRNDFTRQVQSNILDNRPYLVYWLTDSCSYVISERKNRQLEMQEFMIRSFIESMTSHQLSRKQWLVAFCGYHTIENADRFIAILALLREFEEKEDEIINLLKSFE